MHGGAVKKSKLTAVAPIGDGVDCRVHGSAVGAVRVGLLHKLLSQEETCKVIYVMCIRYVSRPRRACGRVALPRPRGREVGNPHLARQARAV